MFSKYKSEAGKNSRLSNNLHFQSARRQAKSDKKYFIMAFKNNKDFEAISPKKSFSPEFSSSRGSSTLSDFTLSDDSFNSNSSSSFEMKNGVKQNCDLLFRVDSNNELSANETNTRKPDRKSFLSMVNLLRNLKLRSPKSTKDQQSILRHPTEYVFIKGMSGLPIRVAKSSAPCCHRSIAKHIAIS